MKTSPLFYLPFICLLSFFIVPQPGINSKPVITSGSELSDIQGTKFATGLRDWNNKPVDSLVMDVFYPTGATSDKKYPTLVFCYGGGFTGGSRTVVTAICDMMADKGFIVVAPDYRTGYDKVDRPPCANTSPTRSYAIYRAVQDINACFRFIYANASQYNIDTANMFIGGSSGGADLAMETAYISDSTVQSPGDKYNDSYQLLGSLNTSGNSLPNTYKLKGIMCLWGALRDDKLIDTNYRAYPSIICYGSNDDSMPDSMGHLDNCPNYDILYARTGIYARMQNQRRACVYYELANGNHSAYDDEFCVEQASCFFKAIMEGRTYSGIYTNYNPSCR
ncbi:MAG TPA: alpha/beta hydrolase [Panacibacter sp.]|nr:alpha/beta hydrolase [Panacibacter sp.]